MFGYVKINKPELLIKDYELYRSVYCGLCKSLGRRYGHLSRMILNYDFTMFALLRLAVSDSVPCARRENCLFSPFSKKMCCGKNAEIDFAGDALVISAYYKVKDDISDGGFLSKLRGMALYPMISHMHRKAAKNSPDAEQILSRYINAQSRLEKERCSDLDKITAPTSEMLCALLTYGKTDTAEKRILECIGDNLGKWIYLIDAVDDIYSDLKKRSYNPVIIKYKLDKGLDALDSAVAECGAILNMSVRETIHAAELLNMRRYDMIIRNIVYMGLPSEQERVMKQFEKGVKPQ